MEKLQFKYKEQLTLHNLDKSKLPVEIKNNIASLDATTGKYNKNPTESILDSIIRKDIEIANAIMNFVEEGLPEEDEFKKQQAAATPPAPPVVVPDPPAPVPVKKSAEEEAAELTAAMETNIKDAVSKSSEKMISKEDITRITGKDHGSDDKIVIGNTVLRKALGRWMFRIA